MKAALLSAFVFPGVGHYFLKKPIPGTVLAGTAFAALYFVITEAVERALKIAAEIQSGAVPLDAAAIVELVSRHSASAETQTLSVATTVFVVAWLCGIADSYRLGHVQKK